MHTHMPQRMSGSQKTTVQLVFSSHRGVPGLSSGHHASQKAPLPNVPMIYFFFFLAILIQFSKLMVCQFYALFASSVSYFVSTASQNWIHFSSVVIDKRGGREGC